MIKKSIIGFLLITLLFLTFSAINGFTTKSSTPDKRPVLSEMLTANEYYEYDVRYGFLKLGSVYVTISDTLFNAKPMYFISASMVSNSSLPFVGQREYRFNSIVEEKNDSLKTHFFWVDNVHRDISPTYSYTFDYVTNQIYSFEHPAKLDTLELTSPAFGGPELLLFSRAHAGKNKEFTYSIVIDNEIREVKANYTTNRQNLRSQLNGERVQVYRADGFADLNGPFGFSGSFQGFSSTDDLKLPLETRVNVWIGSAVVRLTHFEQRK
jgi:hypothetical protein